jgi:hypothetical protein
LEFKYGEEKKRSKEEKMSSRGAEMERMIGRGEEWQRKRGGGEAKKRGERRKVRGGEHGERRSR